MTTVQTSPNTFTVTNDTGIAIGVVTFERGAYVATSANGKVLGTSFASMSAAIAAITGTT